MRKKFLLLLALLFLLAGVIFVLPAVRDQFAAKFRLYWDC